MAAVRHLGFLLYVFALFVENSNLRLIWRQRANRTISGRVSAKCSIFRQKFWMRMIWYGD